MYASILIIFFLFCSSYFRLLVYFSYLIFVYLFFFFLFFFDFFFFFFFFSSRRRHTRLTCDRSSDVCSSDLHIPWPPTNLLAALPFHERLVKAMLEYDLIGFQCAEWLESFRYYCRKELGAKVDPDSGAITLGERTVLARSYPIGIDYEHFTKLGETGEAKRAQRRISSSTRGRKAMIGV